MEKEELDLIASKFGCLLKPPIGLVPKYIRQEQRISEIFEAIVRYFEARKRIPDEWIEEYHELIYELKKT